MTPASAIAPVFKLLTACTFALGCCIGSFMNVVVWRLPRGESLLYPPSHCPKCGHKIPPWENIPIISWLCLRARCSACHQPISIRYPLGEAAVGLLFTLVWYRIFQRNLPLEVVPAFFFLTGALLAAALTDAEHWFIPDEVTLTGIGVAFILAFILPDGRLALAPDPGPDNGALIFAGTKLLLQKININIPQSGIFPALLDTVLGTAMGFSVIFSVAWSIKKLFGRTSLLNAPAQVTLDKDGITTPAGSFPWKQLLPAKYDCAIIHASLDNNPSHIAKINASSAGFAIDGEKHCWDRTLNLNAKRISLPRDVMGGGDIKLMTMLGAFLGADASIYILLTASLPGLCYSLIALPFRKHARYAIPFGPFIALAAAVWMLYGNLIFKIAALRTL